MNKDLRRLKTLKTALLFAAIMESLGDNTWSSVDEVTRWFNDAVGTCCKRTAARYLANLEQVGMLESRYVSCAKRKNRTRIMQYRWIGYPYVGGLT